MDDGTAAPHVSVTTSNAAAVMLTGAHPPRLQLRKVAQSVAFLYECTPLMLMVLTPNSEPVLSVAVG